MVWESLSFALGIALSPFPVIPVLLLLFTPRARAGSTGFALGWTGGILLGVVLATVLGDLLDSGGSTPTWVAMVKVLGGAGLVALGARKWLARGKATEMPSWMTAVQTATPAGAARIGFLLAAANPKILLLAAGAGLVIGAESATTGAEIVSVVVFVLLAALPVLLPVGLFLLLGERVLPPFARAKDWLEEHNAAVMAVVLVVIGLVLLRNGVAGLV